MRLKLNEKAAFVLKSAKIILKHSNFLRNLHQKKDQCEDNYHDQVIWHAVDTFYMSKQNPLPDLLVEPIPINDVMGYTDTDNSQLLSKSIKAQKNKKNRKTN